MITIDDNITWVQRTTTLYRVSRRIQLYNIGKSVYSLIYFSVNIFYYPEWPLPI